MSTQLKLDVRGNENEFFFKVIFFIPGNELSNSVEAFLVLFHFITILLQKI